MKKVSMWAAAVRGEHHLGTDQVVLCLLKLLAPAGSLSLSKVSPGCLQVSMGLQHNKP